MAHGNRALTLGMLGSCSHCATQRENAGSQLVYYIAWR